MSWNDELFAFFDDLEAQAQALADQDREAELWDRSRAEYATVPLTGRLLASLGGEVGCQIAGVGLVRGTLERTAQGWSVLHGHGQDWVVVHSAITGLSGLSERATPEVAWSPIVRLGLGSALRRLADEQVRCVVRMRDGSAHEVVLTRIGQDFAEGRQHGGVGVVLPMALIAAVQSRDQMVEV